MCRWEVGYHQGRLVDKKTSRNKRSELVSKCRHENRYYLCNFPPPISWSLYLTCLSTNMSLNTVSSEPHISFYDHLSSPVFFVSLASHLFVFFPCVFSLVFSLCFISHCSFPLFCFYGFFPSASHPSSHPLTPVSTAPPLPSLFIQGLVSFVLRICLKIGLGRETFSSKTLKCPWNLVESSPIGSSTISLGGLLHCVMIAWVRNCNGQTWFSTRRARVVSGLQTWFSTRVLTVDLMLVYTYPHQCVQRQGRGCAGLCVWMCTAWCREIG